jgi:SEC-C motif-containing protein
MQVANACPCGSQQTYAKCCEPFILGQQFPSNPQALMRSRYSAYCKKDYAYILHTYASQQQLGLTVESLSDHSESTTWLGLEVVAASDKQVEFKAYYRLSDGVYVMHELSDFVQEQGKWRYSTGKMLSDSGKLSIGRNESCVCGSGKKFKRCCGR